MKRPHVVLALCAIGFLPSISSAENLTHPPSAQTMQSAEAQDVAATGARWCLWNAALLLEDGQRPLEAISREAVTMCRDELHRSFVADWKASPFKRDAAAETAATIWFASDEPARLAHTWATRARAERSARAGH